MIRVRYTSPGTALEKTRFLPPPPDTLEYLFGLQRVLLAMRRILPPPSAKF